MNFKSVKFFLPLALLALASGCATHPSVTGGSKTSLLAGALTVSTKSYAPVSPTTLDVNTSTLVGYGAPSGTKVSLLWGLITVHDY